MDFNAQLGKAASLVDRLRVIDWRAACEIQKGGHECGGALHAANYFRKAAGYVPGVADEEAIRFSFCCGREGCRRRVTPPSVRFLGRKVYWGLVVVLLAAASGGVARRHAVLATHLAGLPVSEATVSRWVKWWREEFPVTSLWKAAAGGLQPGGGAWRFPGDLLERFGWPGSPERLLALLEFLSPLTTGSCRPIESRFSMLV